MKFFNLILISLNILFPNTVLIAQNFETRTGKVNINKNKRLYRNKIVEINDFYFSIEDAYGPTTINKYDATTKLVKSTEINQLPPNNKFVFKSGDDLGIIYKESEQTSKGPILNTTQTYYFQKFKSKDLSFEKPIELFKIDKTPASDYETEYQFYESKDHVLINAIIYTGKNKNRSIYLNCYSKEMKLLWSKKTKAPFIEKDGDITGAYLSNDGSFYENWYCKSLEGKNYIQKYSSDDIQKISYKHNGLIGNSQFIKNEKGNLLLFSTYSYNESNSYFRGIKALEISKEFKITSTPTPIDFSTEYMITYASEYDAWDFDKRDKKAQKKGKKEKLAHLSYIDFKEIKLLPTGNILIIGEQEDGVNSEVQNSKFIYLYMYDQSGRELWKRKLAKHQNGYNIYNYISFASFINSGKIYFVFNDHINNYPGTNELKSFQKEPNTTCLGGFEVNLKNGESIKVKFATFKGKQVIGIPKSAIYHNNSLIMQCGLDKKGTLLKLTIN